MLVLSALTICAAAVQVQETNRLSNEQQTAYYFETIRDNPNELRAFFLCMPKGGDIHHHLTGAVYAETMIDLAVEQGLCVNPDSGDLTCPPCETCKTVPIAEAYCNQSLYNKLVDDWSLRNFPKIIVSEHDYFFAIFPEIGPATENIGNILANLRSRAAQENVLYLETMINLPAGRHKATDLGKNLGWEDNLTRFHERLMVHGLGDIAQNVSADIARYHNDSLKRLHCGSAQADPGCNVTVRYQYYALRILPTEEVFAQMVLAFEVATRTPLVVGVNLVGAEDDWRARLDYSLHMSMLAFLHSIYPGVKIDLHAGELALGLVPPEDLRFHVREAIHTGHASRIGHGVDIMYEHDSLETMQEMARNLTVIEILLTSNEDLLNVVGDEHPFPIYLDWGVPIVLATDDPGIERTDLTEQFVLGAYRYPEVNYTDFKRFVRNSIEFSFLPGDSIWASLGNYTQVVEACIADTCGSPSANCAVFLEKSEKARVQWQLERDLAEFEEGIVELLSGGSACSSCLNLSKGTTIPVYTYKVLNTYPHDPYAFTEGLVYKNGYLYEGTGYSRALNIA